MQAFQEGIQVNGKLVQPAYLLLRVVSGLLFLQAGGMKMLDWFGGIPAEHGGHPAAWSQIWIGGAMELYGGLLVMLGLFTRPVAFLLAGEMAVAYWQFHFEPELFWPIQNHGEPAVLLCFVFLLVAAHGGGPWSLDALRRRRAAGK
jgi:putative oxidoreductase